MPMACARSIGTLVYSEATAYKAHKAFVAAKFNGLVLDRRPFDEKERKKPAFLARNPTGKVPYLDTEFGCIATSHAVARYVARCRQDSALYGKSFNDQGEIDTWLEFCLHEVEVPLMTWVYPLLGLMQDPPARAKTLAQRDVQKALGELERRLRDSDFLLGSYVSLADIALVCALREGFERVFDEPFRKPYPKVCSWFERCCALPQFAVVLGDVRLCKEAQAAKPSARAAQNKSSALAEGAASEDPRTVIKAIGDELRLLKEQLRSDGLTGKKLNNHAEVKALVTKLLEFKRQM